MYVSADGDDTAAGTQDAPVATIGKAFEKCKGKTEAVVYLIGKLTCADIGTLPSGVTSLTIAGYGTDSALVLTGPILKYNTTIKRLIFKNLKIVVEANYINTYGHRFGQIGIKSEAELKLAYIDFKTMSRHLWDFTIDDFIINQIGDQTATVAIITK